MFRIGLRLGSNGTDKFGSFLKEEASLSKTSHELGAGATKSGAAVNEAAVKIIASSASIPKAEDRLSILKHDLTSVDASLSPGVSKIVDSILNEPSMQDYCLRRGVAKEEIEALASAKYGGDLDLAAASFIRKNAETWSRLEKAFGESFSTDIIRVDTVARRALESLPGTITPDESSGLSFVKLPEGVFVIDQKTLAQGSFKSAHNAVEYFTGNIGMFLQAKSSPVMEAKTQKVSIEEDSSPFKRLFEHADKICLEIKGAPAGFVADIAEELQQWQIRSPRGVAEVWSDGSENSAVKNELHNRDRQNSIADNNGTFIRHEDSFHDSGTFIRYGDSVIRHEDSIKERDVTEEPESFHSGTFVDRRLLNETSLSGSVARVVDNKNKEPAYAKAMRAGGFFTQAEEGSHGTSVEMTDSQKWKREINFYEELKDVPHMARLHAVVSTEGNEFPGMLMKKYEGDLDEFIVRGKVALMFGEITWDEYSSQASRILADAAECYAGMHAKGIVHRDIKGGNIMTDQGEGIVADLGTVARMSEEAIVKKYEGTPIYSAPESAAGKTTLASDVWSFAIVIHSALVGPMEDNPVVQHVAKRSPFLSLNVLKNLVPDEAPIPGLSPAKQQQAKQQTEFKEKIDAYFSSGNPLDECLKRAFSLNPKERPTMAELADLLRSL